MNDDQMSVASDTMIPKGTNDKAQTITPAGLSWTVYPQALLTVRVQLQLKVYFSSGSVPFLTL